MGGMPFKSIRFKQTLEFQTVLVEKVHDKTTELRVETVALCQMVMQIQLYLGDPCDLSFISYGPDLPPPPPLKQVVF